MKKAQIVVIVVTDTVSFIQRDFVSNRRLLERSVTHPVSATEKRNGERTRLSYSTTVVALPGKTRRKIKSFAGTKYP